MDSANQSPKDSPGAVRKMSIGSDDKSMDPSDKDVGENVIDTAEDAVGAEDIFGDDLSISSEDEDDKPAKKAVNEDEHRVQRYGDDHPELIEGESGSASASASPKI